jgi:hypothetical protein
MPVGDKEAAAVACVNADLQRRGFNPPYDPTLKMGGVPIYGYQSATMIMFHRHVKSCLADKGYSYVYSETSAYMDQTLAMSLGDIYAAISVKTTAVAPAVAGPAEAAPAEAETAPAPAPKRAAKKAAKRRRTAAKVRPAKKKAAKKKEGANRKATAAKRAATGRAQKRKVAKRR